MAQPFVDPCSLGVIDAAPYPRHLRREMLPQRRRMLLVGCILASSMAFIDGSAPTVAAQAAAALGADLASVWWVLNGYVLALAVPERLPIAETTSLNPVNSYGYAKLAVERILRMPRRPGSGTSRYPMSE
jgi:hypothetical protein